MEKRERPKKQCTLCVMVDRNNNRILLGMKKRGFGVGKYNGFGGKVAEGETFAQAALRELREESSLDLKPEHLTKKAEFDFYFPHKPEFNQTVHVYLVEEILGEPKESEEMAFKWFGLNEIPFDKMWDDDKYWLPKVIDGKKLLASFIFKESNGENIVGEQEILEINF